MEDRSKYFTAYFNEWNGRLCEASWCISVNKEHGKVFTIEFANELIEMANEKYKKIFGKEVDFNEVEYDMTDYYENSDGLIRHTGEKKTGRYFKRKNILRIYIDDMPIYENYNGKICRDAAALADSLM